MQGLRVGHSTSLEQGTGASVFLFDQPARASYHLCGASPATSDLAVLDLESNTHSINGLALTGGSVLGLSALSGVYDWLIEKNQGWPVPHGRVPIVPGAAIYDLAYLAASPPKPCDLYKACKEAIPENKAIGRIGAGTGATVGKLVSNAACMSGGLGFAEMYLPHGVIVYAYAVVNCVGDVYDRKGCIIAGAQTSDASFSNTEKYLLAGGEEQKNLTDNTTLVAIFTNAAFSKPELKRIAKVATAGMARAISPIFTRYDGDIIFSVSLGNKPANELTVSAVAAEVTQLAIMQAVTGSIRVK